MRAATVVAGAALALLLFAAARTLWLGGGTAGQGSLGGEPTGEAATSTTSSVGKTSSDDDVIVVAAAPRDSEHSNAANAGKAGKAAADESPSLSLSTGPPLSTPVAEEKPLVDFGFGFVYRDLNGNYTRVAGPPVRALETPLDCMSLFEGKTEAASGAAKDNIPAELRSMYSLRGNVNLVKTKIEGGNYNGVRRMIWSEETLKRYLARAQKREIFQYRHTNEALYDAMAAYPPPQGGHCVVIGSETPWVEAILIDNGVGHVTTYEYSQMVSGDKRISYIHPTQYAERFVHGKATRYDCIASISSVEHDGLGRYGDPLNPQGDLETMAKNQCMLRDPPRADGGLMYLAVPISEADELVWPKHREYGPVRLPMLLANWELLDVFAGGHQQGPHGKNPEAIYGRPGKSYVQPVFVLRRRPAPSEEAFHAPRPNELFRRKENKPHT